MPAPVTPPDATGICQVQRDFQRYQTLAFGGREPAFFALELAGECGELANLEKKIWRQPERSDLKPLLVDEAADVMIAILNYCNSRGIDLEKAVKHKLSVIEERRMRGDMGKAL